MFLNGRFSRQITVVILFFTIAIPIFSATEKIPKAEKGLFNLSRYDFSTQDPVILAGEWEFYWNTLVTEQTYQQTFRDNPDHFIEIPSYWKHLAKKDPQITPLGIATYRLNLQLPETDQPLGLKFRNITPNARILLNAKLVVETGTVHKDRQFSRSGQNILILPVPDEDQNLSITISITNHHNVKGGLNRPITLGIYEELRSSRERQIMIESIFLGGLLLMGFYQLALFLLNPKRKASIFMAIICFMAFFFSGLKNSMALLLLFPGINGEIRDKILYIVLALAAPSYTLYAYNLYPKKLHKWFNWLVVSVGLVTTLVITFTANSFFTIFLIPLEILLIFSAFYIVTSFITAYIKERNWHIFFYLSGLILLIASITFSIFDNEIYFSNQSVSTIFFIFILYQTFLQANIFSRAFREIDSLAIRKSRLEKQNAELFYFSYTDSLTGACNRRLLDDYLVSHWRVNALNNRLLGMFLISIDFFAKYKEIYGHLRGDSCLVKVHEILREKLNSIGEKTLSRYGDKEFAVITSDTNMQKMSDIAEQLRAAIEVANIENKGAQNGNIITISIGYTCLLPSPDEAPELIFDTTAKALILAKENGRNRSEFFNSNATNGSFSWHPHLVK